MRKIKRGFMFIELLLVLALIMFIAFKVFKFYFKNSIRVFLLIILPLLIIAALIESFLIVSFGG